MKTSKLPKSALAFVTSGNTYVLQRRPDLPGRLAYPGKLHFFGGGINEGETPEDAVLRELCDEETNIPREACSAPRPLWEGQYWGEDKHGLRVLRYIHLIGVEVPEDLNIQPTHAEGGGVEHVAQNLLEVAKLSEEGQMAPFAACSLYSHLLMGAVLLDEADTTWA